MSEYIYDTSRVETHPEQGFTGEEIIRCRDCEHYDPKRYGCWWFAHAERQQDYSWADEPSDVEPDGFCSWGERKSE